MGNPWFRFKRFTIRQDRCAMKVGTDGTLLGAWTAGTDEGHILDIGTGTGLLALIAAQRNPTARIDAVEVDAEAAAQAAENVLDSPWADRITVHHADVREWTSTMRYGLVLCNPPFYSGHSVSQRAREATAKHDGSLSLPELVEALDRLCGPNGRFSSILPFERYREMEHTSARMGFKPVRKCIVQYMAHKPPKRVMVEFSRNAPSEVGTERLIVERSPGEFTVAYKELLQDLELHF